VGLPEHQVIDRLHVLLAIPGNGDDPVCPANPISTPFAEIPPAFGEALPLPCQVQGGFWNASGRVLLRFKELRRTGLSSTEPRLSAFAKATAGKSPGFGRPASIPRAGGNGCRLKSCRHGGERQDSLPHDKPIARAISIFWISTVPPANKLKGASR
jgi:hypothetical protein